MLDGGNIAGAGEREVCDRLNNHYMSNKIKSFAYRLKQSRGVKQWTDVLSDSRLAKYFMAIEVKAMHGVRALNFKSDFTYDDERQEHQLERQVVFAKRTGRKAFVVVYVRNGRGRRNGFYVFDSKVLLKKMKAGDKSILAREFDEYNIKNELWRIVNK